MTFAKSHLLNLRKIAAKSATKAGLHIQSQIDQSYSIQGKKGGDSLASQVVTEVDLRSQEIILDHLRQSMDFYDLGLLTEEASDDRSRFKKDYFWCIDPLDGTLPFTEKRPGYAVSIALISNAGDPVLGVVYVPHEQICYSAVRGEGVLRNGHPFHRISLESDDQLHWFMDRSFRTASYFEETEAKLRAYANQRKLKLQIHSTFGAVVNAIGVVTSGTGCYFKFPKNKEGGGSIWDFAATRLLFEELGLYVSNWKGEKLHLNDTETTFMNRQGAVYTTNDDLMRFLNGNSESV